MKIKFFSKTFVFIFRIKADSQNEGVFCFKFIGEVAEPATLGGSSRCIGFGVKPKNHSFSSKVIEGYGVSIVILSSKIWSFASDI